MVHVKDDVRSGKQTGGKQSGQYASYGCFYTRVTGIWQTVWMEAVDAKGLKTVVVRPDIDQKQLVVMPEFYQESDYTLEVVLKEKRKFPARTTLWLCCR